jgi:hypothetical protein
VRLVVSAVALAAAFVLASAQAAQSTGRRALESIVVSNTKSTPVKSAPLDKTHAYRVTATGTVSDWCTTSSCPAGDPTKTAQANVGVDALYCYAKWRCPTPELWRQLSVNGKGLDELAGREGKIPYNAGHAYSVELDCLSGPLSFVATDAVGSAGDNSGQFNVTISDLGPSPKCAPKCRKPARLEGASEGCGGEVSFAIKQGGLPKRARSVYLDMTTNGIGRGSYDDDLKPEGAQNRLKGVTGRVVRTVEYIDKNGPGIPEEYTMVFEVEGGYYVETPSSDAQTVRLALKLLSSTDPACPRVKAAALVAQDGGSLHPDAIRLIVSPKRDPADCRDESVGLVEGAPGKKPLVQVAISLKENKPA